MSDAEDVRERAIEAAQAERERRANVDRVQRNLSRLGDHDDWLMWDEQQRRQSPPAPPLPSYIVNARVYHTCEQAIEAAVIDERERCAKMIEAWAEAAHGFTSLHLLAQAIRNGEPKA